ncbi:MAG: mannitol dehydrogenase family protein [Rhizobiaceae bacterium]|nr:mannitol dehydrogenase family protein [Rhizobiaceae bacterium]
MSRPRLASLGDVTGPARLPAYRPEAHGTGIVHLGLGAFHRAHQAVATDDALEAQGGDWRICAVSLRSTALAEALSPQNGLYTLIERGVDGTRARVIGALSQAIANDPAATLAALCDPAIKIVTLTVTEKGYGIDRASGAHDPAHPAVAADLKSPQAPSGVLGLLTAALGARRKAGAAPFTVLCCDNLPENGGLLRGGVIGFARAVDPDLADFIAAEVAFPSSMVDRITPAATDRALADAADATGCTDLAAVETEAFSQWVIEDRFPQGRPAWEAGGAIFVADVTPFKRAKLTMLNGTHSMLAYAGFLSGREFVRDVMEDRDLSALVRRHLNAAAAVLPALPELELRDYAAALEARFRNPSIDHATYQIAMDGTEKLPQRIFAPARAALAAGRPIRPFAFATAAWMRYALGTSDAGARYALRDPREAEIRTRLDGLPRDAKSIAAALHGLPNFVPDELASSPQWRTEIEQALGAMLDKGMAAAIAAEANS